MGEAYVARHAGEGDALWMLGGLYEVKATGEETGGRATVMQMTVPAGMGPPPHVHDCDEFVYVIDGTGTWHVGGESIEGGPGSLFFFRAGTVETFEPTSELKVLIIYSPGGTDKFFAEFGERAESRELPPAPDGPPDIERLVAVAGRYGMEIRAPEGA